MQLTDYDRIVVYFSGGKDSISSTLHLIELGAKDKIELWHQKVDGRKDIHEVDGREGSTLMDWPSTPSYCIAVANSLRLPLYFSWKVGGFEREMLRENALTAPTRFAAPDGKIHQAGGTRGKLNTRRKFPQVSADLSVRWCSAYLKIDVARLALNNQPRFKRGKTLVVSGERAEESPARAKYNQFEPENHRAGRHVDRWRPVLHWPEQEVWNTIEKWRINPHPAYRLGWGRLSCRACIFGSHDQWASLAKIDPRGFERIAAYEREFGLTIHRSLSVEQRARIGTPFPNTDDADLVALALSHNYDAPIRIDDWKLPAGAFGDSSGPS
jgi:3'-phosphoadenosine 5'-phosphosulfate sulfotransferase (PAPS reductase)/FAD synthetase